MQINLLRESAQALLIIRAPARTRRQFRGIDLRCQLRVSYYQVGICANGKSPFFMKAKFISRGKRYCVQHIFDGDIMFVRSGDR